MHYILINRKQLRSRTGARMWRLTWVCVEDLTVWETTVADDMDNYKINGWRNPCNSPTPWGVYTGLRRTKKTTSDGTPIITADSRQELVLPIDSQDIAADIIITLKEEANATLAYSI